MAALGSGKRCGSLKASMHLNQDSCNPCPMCSRSVTFNTSTRKITNPTESKIDRED